MRRISYSVFLVIVAAIAFTSCNEHPAEAPGARDTDGGGVAVSSRSDELRLQSTALPNVAGLREHLDASSLQGVAEGAPVTSWTARVGKPAVQVSDQGTQIAPPVYATSAAAMNGRPSLRFGKNSRNALAFSLAEGTGAVPTSPALTVVVVGSRSSDAESSTLWHNDHIASGRSLALRLTDTAAAQGVQAMEADAPARTLTGGGAAGKNAPTIATLRVSATGLSEIFRDGIPIPGTTWSAGSVPLAGVIGSLLNAEGTTPSERSSGFVSELLVYDRALADEELADVHDHLNAKYEILPFRYASGLMQWVRADHCSGSYRCRGADCAVSAAGCDNLALGGTPATQSELRAQPRVAWDTLVGRQALRFDGRDDVLNMSSTAPANTDYTVVAVATAAPLIPRDAHTWIRADKCEADGTSCPDLTGNGHTIVRSHTQGSPTRTAGAIGGQTGLVFGPTSNNLQRLPAAGEALADAFTVTFVVQGPNDPQTKYLWNYNSTGTTGGKQTALYRYQNSTGVYMTQDTSYPVGPSTTAGGVGMPSDRPVIVTATGGPGGLTVYIDGSRVGSASVPVFPAPLAGNFLSGTQTLGEMVLFARELEPTELDDLHGYLGARYGIVPERIVPPLFAEAHTWLRADHCAADGSSCPDLTGNGHTFHSSQAMGTPASAPTTPPQQDLYHWYRAEDCSQNPQNLQTTCLDIAGHENAGNGSPGASPAVVANALGGRHALVTGPATQGVTAVSPTSPSSATYTMSFVAALDATTDWMTRGQFLWIADSARAGGGRDRTAVALYPKDGRVNLHWSAHPNYGVGPQVTTISLTGSVATLGQPFITTIRAEPSRTELYINGLLVATGGGTIATQLAGYFGLGHTLRMGEGLMYGRALNTTSELPAMHRYLSERYGITLANPGTIAREPGRIGGQPGLVFNQSSGYLTRVPNPSENPEPEFTVSYVARVENDGFLKYLWSHNSTSNVGGKHTALYGAASGNVHGIYFDQDADYASGGPGISVGGSGLPMGQPVVITATGGASGMALYVNGQLFTQPNSTPAFATHLAGTIASGSQVFGELLMFNRVLNQSDLAQLHTYVGKRYGIDTDRLTPPVPVLRLAKTWMRADRCATDGKKCVDQTGRGNTLIPLDPANPPQLNPTGIGGRPAFAGDFQRLATANELSHTQFTASFVVQMPSTAGLRYLWRSNIPAGSTANSVLYGNSGTAGAIYFVQVGHGAGDYLQRTNLPSGNPVLVTITGGPAGKSMYINGALVTPANTTQALPMQLAGVVGAAGVLLGEVSLYNTVLTTAQLNELHGYLGARYGVVTGQPAPTTNVGDQPYQPGIPALGMIAAGDIWNASSSQADARVFLGMRPATQSLMVQHGVRTNEPPQSAIWTMDAGASVGLGTPQLVTLRAQGGSHELSINCGTPVIGADSTPVLFSGALGAKFEGNIAEVLLFSGRLSNVELAEVHSYLGRRYGIATNECGPKCGDGVVGAGEACDHGSSARCNEDCTAPAAPTECFDSGFICPSGSSCPTIPNGTAFGFLGSRRFCVPTVPCLTNPAAGCGETQAAPCGRCTLTPSCDAKRCGDDMSDGAGGLCLGVCAPKVPGCQSDTDCTDGYVCGKSAADLFEPSAPSDANACWPIICADIDPRRRDCGTTASPCGLCEPINLTACFAGELCNAATSSCGANTVGNEVGACIPLQGPGYTVTDDVEATSVGALPGSLDVTAAGAATYRVPVKLPPGRGDLQPSLSIAYNSSQGNGLLGLGWGVDGLSSVSLCTKTKASDPEPTLNRPALCLDGQRLIPIGYDTQKKRTEWRTETENFALIYSSPGDLYNQTGSDNTPDTFVVKHKNGVEMSYGVEPLARLAGDTYYYRDATRSQAARWKLRTRMWAISRLADRAGNRVAYLYSRTWKEVLKGDSENVELLPRWIGYNFAAGDSTDRKAGVEIKFEYLSEGTKLTAACRANPMAEGCKDKYYRPDRSYGFWQGSPVTHEYHLGGITVSAVGKKVRRYSPSYRISTNGLSELSAITECVFDSFGNQVCRPATEFDYEPADSSLDRTLPAPKFKKSTIHAAVLNWNGDAYDDMVFFDHVGLTATSLPEETVKIHVHLGSPTGLADTPVNSFEFPANEAESQVVRQPVPYITDVDSDGYDDILVQSSETHELLRFARGAARGPLLTWPGSWDGTFRFLDMDADGDKDALFCDPVVETGGAELKYLANTRGKFAADPTLERSSIPLFTDNAWCDDYAIVNSGDGREQFVWDAGEGPEGTSSLSAVQKASLDHWGFHIEDMAFTYPGRGWQYLSATDWNGDGLRDLLTLALPYVSGTKCPDRDEVPGCDNKSLAFMNSGDELRWSQTLRVPGMGLADVTADFDQDGRVEYGVRGGVSHENDLDLSEYGASVRTIRFPNRGSVTVLDVNGDGRSDFYQSKSDRIYLGGSPNANLLKTVRRRETPLGVPDEILVSYASGAAPGVYTPGESGTDCDKAAGPGVARCVKRLGTPVVKSVVRNSLRQVAAAPEVVQSSTQNYYYEDARTDQLGRGWIGFKKRTILSLGVGGVDLSSKVEEYDLSPYVRDSDKWFYYPFAGVPKKVVVTALGSSNKFTRSTGIDANTVSESKHVREVRLSWRGGPFVVETSRDSQLSDYGEVVDQVHREQTFDTFGNLKSSGTTWPLETTHAEGSAITYAYEKDPVLITKWQVDLVEENLVGGVAAVSGPAAVLFSVTRYKYDAAGLIFSVHTGISPDPEDTDDRSLLTVFSRDSWQNVDLVTQRPGDTNSPLAPRVWSFDYEPKYGVHVVETQNPEGHVESTNFSLADGLLRAYSDANRVNTRWKYDGFGRLIEEDRKTEGIVTQVFYYPPEFFATVLPAKNASVWVGSVTKGASGSTVIANVAYDSHGRVVARQSQGFRDGSKVIQEYQYDELGRLAVATRPHLVGDNTQGSNTFGYDSLGRMIRQTTADLRETNFYYASTGSISPEASGTYAIDGRTDARYFRFVETPRQVRTDVQITDARGNTIIAQEGGSGALQFRYGANGFLVSTTDVAGNAIVRTPDKYGALTMVDDPSTGLHSYSYNPWGEISAYQHNTETHHYTYDNLGRALTRENSDGVSEWVWDTVGPGWRSDTTTRYGELLQVKSPGGHIDEYSYLGTGGSLDAVHRSIKTDGAPVNLTSSYGYDDLNRLSRVGYPGAGGLEVEYKYTATGMLQSVVNPSDGKAYWKTDDVYQGYRASRVSFGDDTREELTFDPHAGWLTDAKTFAPTTASPLQATTIGYDANGNVERLDRQAEAVVSSVTYEYDELDRLKTVTRGSGASTELLSSYSYKPALGQLDSKSDMGIYTYGEASQTDEYQPKSLPYAVRQIVSASGVHNYHYDAFGRMDERAGPSVAGGAQKLRYNAVGQLDRIEESSGAATEIKYSAVGDRVFMKEAGGTTRAYFGPMYELSSPSGGVSTETYRIMVNGRAIAEIALSAGGQPDVAYLHRDHLGTVELVTSKPASGPLRVERKSYGAFGEHAPAAPGAKAASVGYTGHREEAAAGGLTDMVGRFYDPNMGRFVSPDPFIPHPLAAKGYDRYAYVINNPLSRIDPTGFEDVETQPPVGDALAAWCANNPDNSACKGVTGGDGPDDDDECPADAPPNSNCSKIPDGCYEDIECRARHCANSRAPECQPKMQEPKEEVEETRGVPVVLAKINRAQGGSGGSVTGPSARRGSPSGPGATTPLKGSDVVGDVGNPGAAWDRSALSSLTNPAFDTTYAETRDRMWTEYTIQSAMSFIPVGWAARGAAAVLARIPGVSWVVKNIVAKGGAQLTGGAARVAQFAKNWAPASLDKAIARHAGPNATSWVSATGKTIFENPATGRQVVVDPAGYFRIFQPKAFGSEKGVYLDMLGNIPNPRGVQGAVLKDVRQQMTHFLFE